MEKNVSEVIEQLKGFETRAEERQNHENTLMEKQNCAEKRALDYELKVKDLEDITSYTASLNNLMLELRNLNKAIHYKSNQVKLTLAHILHLKGKEETAENREAVMQSLNEKLPDRERQDSAPPLLILKFSGLSESEHLKIENENLTKKVAVLEAENNQLNLQLGSLSEVEELKRRLSEIEAERERLSEELLDYEWKIRLTEILAPEHKFVQLNVQKIEELERENKCLQEIIMTVQRMKSSQKSPAGKKHVVEFNTWHGVHQIRQENQTLRNRIARSKSVVQKWKGENFKVNKQMKEMGTLLSKKDETISDYKQQIDKLKEKCNLMKECNEKLVVEKNNSARLLDRFREQIRRGQSSIIDCCSCLLPNVLGELKEAKNTTYELRNKLKQTNDNIASFQLIVKYLDDVNARMQRENESLSHELYSATKKIRRLSRDVEASFYCENGRCKISNCHFLQGRSKDVSQLQCDEEEEFSADRSSHELHSDSSPAQPTISYHLVDRQMTPPCLPHLQSSDTKRKHDESNCSLSQQQPKKLSEPGRRSWLPSHVREWAKGRKERKLLYSAPRISIDFSRTTTSFRKLVAAQNRSLDRDAKAAAVKAVAEKAAAEKSLLDQGLL